MNYLFRTYLSSLQLMSCRVAAVKVFLYIIIVQTLFFFWSFVVNGFILNHLETRFLLKPMLEGSATVVHFITGHEQFQSNRVCFFLLFCVFLASK